MAANGSSPWRASRRFWGLSWTIPFKKSGMAVMVTNPCCLMVEFTTSSGWPQTCKNSLETFHTSISRFPLSGGFPSHHMGWKMGFNTHMDIHIPIGSMYGIYANIWGILMVNVTIYGIHGSYGIHYHTFMTWMIWGVPPRDSSMFVCYIPTELVQAMTLKTAKPAVRSCSRQGDPCCQTSSFRVFRNKSTEVDHHIHHISTKHFWTHLNTGHFSGYPPDHGEPQENPSVFGGHWLTCWISPWVTWGIRTTWAVGTNWHIWLATEHG